MVTYIWLSSDSKISRPSRNFTKYFGCYDSDHFSIYANKEVWEPFLHPVKGENLIVSTGGNGLPSDIIKRISNSYFDQKILSIKEVPWRKNVKKINLNIKKYLTIFDKIYTYVKSFVNDKDIFFRGIQTGFIDKINNIYNINQINFTKKYKKINMCLNAYSRTEIFHSFFTLMKQKKIHELNRLSRQLIRNPNATLKLCGVKYNRLYGVRNYITQYIDKFGILDTYGKGWRGLKNHKGYAMVPIEKYLKYRWTLCIENNDINNYISEKSIQALMAGSIPIYLGGPKPNDALPLGSYVDLRKIHFRNLFDYINSESNYEYHLKILKKEYSKILEHYDRFREYYFMINKNCSFYYDN